MKNRRSSKKKGGRKRDKKSLAAKNRDENSKTDVPTPVEKTPSPPEAADPVLRTRTMDETKHVHCFHKLSATFEGDEAFGAILDCLCDTHDHLSAKMSMVYREHQIVLEQPNLAQLIYAFAAFGFLDEANVVDESWSRERGRRLVQAAILVEKRHPLFAVHGGGSFSETELHQVQKKMNRLGWCLVKHCGSKRDLVAYLDKKIPCNCLSEVKKKVMEEPEIRECNYCHQEVTDTKWCEDCLAVEYCSKSCQVADWPNHMLHCQLFTEKIDLFQASQNVIQAANRRRRCLGNKEGTSRPTGCNHASST